MNRVLANNIRYLMDNAGIATATELSRRCGVAQPTLFRWMAADAREPRHSKLQPLADYFGVGLVDLLEKDLSTGEKVARPKATARAQVPMVPASQVSDLQGYLLEGNYESWPSIYLKPQEEGFAFRVNSALFEPEIPANSVIIVQASREPKDGDLVVALVGQSTAPVLRRMASEGVDKYLVPLRNDMEMLRVTEQTQIVGVVSEIQTIKKL